MTSLILKSSLLLGVRMIPFDLHSWRRAFFPGCLPGPGQLTCLQGTRRDLSLQLGVVSTIVLCKVLLWPERSPDSFVELLMQLNVLAGKCNF